MSVESSRLRFFLASAVGGALLAFAAVVHAGYRGFASFRNGVHEVMTLEYEVRDDGWGVRWRVTNTSDKPYYDVGVEDKVYTMNDDSEVKRSGESCREGKLGPGESCVTLWDPVGYEGKPKVKKVTMKHPLVNFAMEKNGKRYGAGEVFEVK